MKLTESIAEFLGMHIGDGTLYRVGNSVVWELRGDLEEKNYYDFHVTKILNKIFKKKFLPKYRSGGKNGCYGIQTTDSRFSKLLQEYGYKPGSKTYSAHIPIEIFKGTHQIKESFIRGLFDTDGCIRFDSTSSRYKQYPKIEFGFASKNLRDDLVNLLKQLNMGCYIWTDRGKYTTFKLCAAGNEKTIRWFKVMGSQNPKHLEKYKRWLQDTKR